MRGQCILNHRWADQAPSALAGNRSRGGAPDQRLQPKSEMQNNLVSKRCIMHFPLHYDGNAEEEEEVYLLWGFCGVYTVPDRLHALVILLLLLLLRSPAIGLGFTILDEIFAYVTAFSPIIEVVTFRLQSLSVFMDGACWMCFCRRHSSV